MTREDYLLALEHGTNDAAEGLRARKWAQEELNATRYLLREAEGVKREALEAQAERLEAALDGLVDDLRFTESPVG